MASMLTNYLFKQRALACVCGPASWKEQWSCVRDEMEIGGSWVGRHPAVPACSAQPGR